MPFFDIDVLKICTLSEAPPLTLAYPIGVSGGPILIGDGEQQERLGFVLDPARAGMTTLLANRTQVRAVIVDAIRIEPDVTSAKNVHYEEPLLLLVRAGTTLQLVAKVQGRDYGYDEPQLLRAGMPEVSGETGFTRWRIVTGEGVSERTLHTFDVTQPIESA